MKKVNIKASSQNSCKIILLLFTLLSTNSLIGQKDSLVRWQGGLFMEVNSAKTRINKNLPVPFSGLSNNIEAITVSGSEGFSLGTMAIYNLSQRSYLSFSLVLSFQTINLDFTTSNRMTERRTVGSATFEVPLMFSYRLSTRESLNPVLNIGGRYIHEMNQKDKEKYLDVKNSDFSLDAGVGIELIKSTKFGLFIFSPSLIYSRGMVNLDNGEIDVFNTAIDSLKRDKITFRVLLTGR